MNQLNVLGIQATIKSKDVQQGANEFIQQINRMEMASNNFTTNLAGKASIVNGEVREMGNTFDGVANKIIKGAAAMGIAFSAQQFISRVIKVRGEFQQLEVAFNTMLGSAEKANSLMAEITKTAAITPFNLQDVAGGAKQLLAYGVASENVNDTLIRLGDIAAGLSIPLNDLVYLYGTTMTQGRMFTQDLRQFQGRGIPLADELAKQFGVTKDKVGELVTAGKVGFEEMNKAIVSMTSEGGKFGGLMEAQSKTITGQISNIEDAIDGMFNEIGQSSEGLINTGLGVVSSLVQNYEKVGEAIGVAVTAYGAYKAALMVGIAWQRAEAAVTAEAALQKTLAAMAGHTLTTAQARGAAMSQLYAAAQAKVAASLKALVSATLLNPYVLIAAAIAGATYGLYKFATAESESEKFVKNLNKTLDEQAKKHDEQRRSVNELVSSLNDLELSESTRLSNFLQLKAEYPEILKDINDENEFLREKTRLLKLINEESDKKRQLDYLDALTKAENEYNAAIKRRDSALSRATTDEQKDLIRKNFNQELDIYKGAVDEQKSNIASYDLNKYIVGIKDLKSEELSSALEDATNILQALENAGEGAIGYVTELNMQLSKSQIRTLKAALENEQDVRSGTKQSASEWVTQYKKEYDAALKAVSDFKKKKQDLTESQFERGLKEVNDKLDAAKAKYEAAGGSLKSDRDTIKQQKNLANELLSIKRKNQQDEINLMEEGSEKRIKQIELNYQKEIDAIENQAAEWKSKQGGILTNEQHSSIGLSLVLAEDAKEKGIKAIYDEEKEAMNNYLKEYGTWMQKREAVTEEYQQRIKKATTQGEKLSLGEQMKRELAEIDNAAQGSVTTITKLFDDMSEKSVAYMREIADEAELMLAYLKAGNWEEFNGTGKDAFGLTKEQFEVLKASPEKLKAIVEQITGVRDGANEAESSLKKLGKSLKDIFNGDYKEGEFESNLNNLLGGIGKINDAAKFLGDSLGSISDSFGGNFLGGIGEGIGVATDAIGSAMSGAQAGAMFGPWGAAAGAALGMVTSLVSSFSKLHDKKHERKIQKLQDQIEVLEKTYEKLGEEIEDAYSNDASELIEDQNKLLEQQKVLIQQQIKEEEEKKKTDKGRIEEWKEQIEEIDALIEDNKEAAIDAIFGNDLKSAIEDFASAYVEAWSAGEDKAKSAKDMVKNMIKNMITESIKAAASDPMKAIRDKLLQFWSDEYISGWEQDYLNQMATDLQKELDEKFGWADGIMGGSAYEQEASNKGFQTMSQETGEELNGRFTALQIANEEIKRQTQQQTVLQQLIVSDTAAIKSEIAIQNQYISEITSIQYESVGYLAEISKNTKQLYEINERLGLIEENTKNI